MTVRISATTRKPGRETQINASCQGCSAPTTYDGCVTHIRWTLQNDLSYIGPDNTGDVQFVARIQ